MRILDRGCSSLPVVIAVASHNRSVCLLQQFHSRAPLDLWPPVVTLRRGAILSNLAIPFLIFPGLAYSYRYSYDSHGSTSAGLFLDRGDEMARALFFSVRCGCTSNRLFASATSAAIGEL